MDEKDDQKKMEDIMKEVQEEQMKLHPEIYGLKNEEKD